MLKFPESFDGRPVAFVGIANGMFGGLRAVEQLQMIFAYRNAYLYPRRVFIPGARTKFAPDGTLIDTELNDRLARQVDGFARFGRCVAGSA
jgi:chromate reductase, NAD(P)H dehydrogenase (quinone)